MEMSEGLNVLDPDGKIAALFDEPGESEAAAVNHSAYSVRAASPEDAADLQEVERRAFPTLFPATRFNSELARANARYYVAVRDWTEEELSQDPDPLPTVDNIADIAGMARKVRSAFARLLFGAFGGRKKTRSEQFLAGLVGLWYVLDEAHVVMIGLRPEERRKGLGELLLISALEAAMRHGSRVVTLEVRRSNEVARGLYHKYGFREVGVRKRYYADNNEDAVIMTTPPIQSDPYWDTFHKLTRDHADRWGEAQRDPA